ncbi:MAG: ATP-binding protein [bacterium]
MIFFKLDSINVLIILIALANLIYGLIIYSRNRREVSNLFFLLLTLSVAGWGISIFFYRGAIDNISALFFSKLLYLSADVIPFIFLYLCCTFPDRSYKLTYTEKFLLPLFFIAILVVTSIPGYLIEGVNLMSKSENIIKFNLVGHTFFVLYQIICFGSSYLILFKKWKQSQDVVHRQIMWIFIGTLFSTSIALTTNMFLPYIGYFELNWMGQVGVVVMIVSISYAIMKYHLFSVRVIATEILTFLLWIFVFVKIFASESFNERLGNIILFAFTLLIGYFLIKNVQKEIKNREKIESLANDLEQANIHLKELDQQKSEFVSLASHQLRGPLTAVKGYASMLLDNDFGAIQDSVRDAVDKIFKSTQDLVIVVGDYLDVSRIEQGRMQYDFSQFDMKELVATVITELRPNLERANLSIDFNYEPNCNFTVNADQGKIKQVIGNIIDNSIKYTPKGSIHVWLNKSPNNKILITISDTGVGINPDVLPRLFEKFTRAPGASKTNIMGTGLGLYVAKKMVEAHNGRVWAESEGVGKGASFFIELDMVNS